MASRKTGNTNKTAHVLNVIAGASTPRPEPEPTHASQAAPPPVEMAEPVVSAPESVSAAPAPAQPQHPVPPILQVARATDEALSQQIRDALEQAVEAEDLSKAPDDASEAAPLSGAPLQEAAASGGHPADPECNSQPAQPLLEEEPSSTALPELGDAALGSAAGPSVVGPEGNEGSGADPQPSEIADALQESSTAPAPGQQPPLEDPEELLYVNVMQQLVEEKAMRYIQMFGMCDCPRCVIDVKALALTNLPAKYVVMHRGDMVPMLTVYENRFSTAITAQLIQACKAVSENPRHNP